MAAPPSFLARVAGKAIQSVAMRHAHKGALPGQRVPLTEAGVRALQESTRIDRKAGMMAGMKAGAIVGGVFGTILGTALLGAGFALALPWGPILGALGGAAVGAVFGLAFGSITPPRVADIRKHAFSATGIVSYGQSGVVLEALANAGVLKRGAHGAANGLSLAPGWDRDRAAEALEESHLALNDGQIADILKYLELTDALVAKHSAAQPEKNSEAAQKAQDKTDEKPPIRTEEKPSKLEKDADGLNDDAPNDLEKRFTALEKGKGPADFDAPA